MELSKKVYSYYWYVVDLADPFRPSLMYNVYQEQSDAKNAIQRGLKGNFKRYQPIAGYRAIANNYKFIPSKTKATKVIKILRYDYPETRKSKQNRKTYRTIMRRRAKANKE